MITKVFSTLAITVMVGSSFAADYCFPSPMNPAGKDPAGLEQYITIIWDDNGYSGLKGTMYEADTGTTESSKKYQEKSFVGGEFPWGAQSPNDLNIGENEIGMSWATNLGVKMTFNPITGLFLPVWGPSWDDRESKLGYYKDEVGSPDHKRISVSWGREYTIENPQGTYQEGGQINNVFEDALSKGHEIGNHTIDHMESNSPVPGGDAAKANLGFGRWDNEGFDYSVLDTMPWNKPGTNEKVVYDETEEMGTAEGAAAHTMGWKIYAGKYISKKAWRGAIDLGEEQLKEYLDISVSNGKVYGFRAPRLEVNSELYFALSEAGYEYDCGLEEGYEEHRDGTNFLWPYTLDNGPRNPWTQYSLGEMRFIDSMPSELWQLPVNVVIVPEDIRSKVWDNHKEVMIGEGENPTDSDKQEWIQNSGKITGFDFNTWILWGMEKSTWIETMKNSTTKRLEGNKAPFHYGAHTQYYTPMYDNANLLTDFNINDYGLCVVNGWNDYKVRIQATEEWINWAKGQGCKFVTGHEMVEKMHDLASEAPSAGDPVVSDKKWAFYRNTKLENKSEGPADFTDNADDYKVTVAAPEGDEYPFCAYTSVLRASELTHLSLDYKVKAGALAIRLHFSDDIPSREVILNNTNTSDFVSSGKIPLHAFDYNEYEDPDKIKYSEPIDASKIVSIEIQPLAPVNGQDGTYTVRKKPYDVTFSVRNITAYGSDIEWHDGTSVVKSAINKDGVSIQGVQGNKLSYTIPVDGKYSLTLTTVTGRVIHSFNNKQLVAGTNSLPLSDMSKGIYLLQLNGNNNKLTTTKKLVIK